MTIRDWISLFTLATNIGVLLTVVRVAQYFTRIEVKVESMWLVFMREHGARVGDKSL